MEIATSASKGQELLVKTNFDCIISDYSLPKKDGIEFLTSVREDHPNLPFILFTWEESESVAQDAIAVGANDYMRKRVGTEQFGLLSEQIINAVSHYRAEQPASEASAN